ncbi:MAG: prephenate dehydrogenase [Bacteroidetes bacterium]|nr:prephenate dehydrogenase [Bacteroidota bacterium]MBU1372036.1 prephenate dehydrogenase [Bacteroidota bacterium]MBU1483638.1 prephenate dehydrogenase [Bacteroidota bacterium]MBU1760857.1 prephenate dehydrogenase [Bacteroidota bacterium]MBU2046847.1 prephenate dehydrogenase [Bacteroidota bacterium]
MKIGIIGLGDMGKLYALTFAKAGLTVVGCDIPEHKSALQEELAPFDIQILDDSREVSHVADFIFYAVEAEKIDEVVSQTAYATKSGAIVTGMTSVKTPEVAAFEKYLPTDSEIILTHALHGPGFETKGQKLIVAPHRISKKNYQKALKVLKLLESEIIELEDYHQHDQIMADTQAVTHMGFESMGTAWKNAGTYPWESGAYVSGIDNVKILTTLRIFSYKAHIYAGLAILNPYASKQIEAYAQSESALFKMMIQEDEANFRERIYKARDFVFHEQHDLILFDDAIMKEFSIGDNSALAKSNSHLSLLAMVDAWYQLQINPYDNLVGQTPPFKLRLGIVEYLFKNDELLEETIRTALYDKSIRGDDLEFHTAVREWASIIKYKDMEGYKSHFKAAKDFFEPLLEKGREQSALLIKRLS